MQFRNAQREGTRGAVWYRAGRFQEAIDALIDTIDLSRQSHGLVEHPREWAFLAMAHHRLGQLDEARQWLQKLQARNHRLDWDNIEYDLLRKEAESLLAKEPEAATSASAAASNENSARP